MSEYTSPLAAAFELQRTTIKQSQKALEQSIAFQKRMNETVVDGFESQEDSQRSGVEFYQDAIHGYLDAVEATVPGAGATMRPVRKAVDDGFDQLLEGHAEAFESIESEYERGAELSAEYNEEYLAALDEQLTILLEMHADVEHQTIEAFDTVLDQYEEMQTEMEGQAEEFQIQFEEQSETFQEQFEKQVETFQHQLEEMQARFEDMQARTAETVDIE